MRGRAARSCIVLISPCGWKPMTEHYARSKNVSRENGKIIQACKPLSLYGFKVADWIGCFARELM